MKSTFLPLMLVLLGFIHGNAQPKNTKQATTDSIKKEFPHRLSEKFPIKRNFEVQFDHLAPTDFTPEWRDKVMGSGEIKSRYRIKTSVNVPIVKKQTWNIAANLRYKYEVFEFGYFNKSTENTFPALPYKEVDFQYLTAGLTFSKTSTLFNRRAIHTASLTVDGSNKGLERVRGFTTVTLILKSTKNTTVGVGLSGFIDRSALSPVLPIFLYQHKFKNSKYSVDFSLPQRVMIRSMVGQNGRVSLGSELDNDLFYLYGNQPDLQGTLEYRQIDLKSGVTYEHYLGNNVIATLRAGINNVVVSKATKKNQSLSDYQMKTKQDATRFLSVGLSYNPFK